MLGNESSMLILMLRTKVPENESSKKRKFHLWNFRSWDESSRVRKFQLPILQCSASVCRTENRINVTALMLTLTLALTFALASNMR